MKKFLLSISIFGLLLILPSTATATGSTVTLSTATITTDARDQFNQTETPSINVESSSSLTQNIAKLFNTLRGRPTIAQATITSPQGEIILEKNLKSGTNNLTVENEKLSPGKYKIMVNDQELTTFRWGVLALNTNQDTYQAGENIYFQVASLSETGHTLCDSNLRLTVGGQDVPLNKSETCGANNVTDTPDYYANYQLTTAGSHVAELTNLDNSFKITKTINIGESTPFTVERVGATRINPFKADYTMIIKIKANQHGYSGEIKEQLPTSFIALSPITWTTDLKSGEEKIFTYTYRAPKVSPAIFNLGPIVIDSYQEASTWSLASDATFQMQTGYYLGSGTDDRAITGVGFQPDLVLIKDDTGNGTEGVVWKSSTMAGEVSAKLGENEADLATDAIQSLDSDGFTLGTDDDVNGVNIRFTWVAYSGSDCTSSGTFCVGTYTGDGTATHAITSVGFQPDFVTIKSSTTTHGVFRTSSMGTNVAQVVGAVNESTDGTRFKTLDSTGFTVGNNAQVNTNATNYWYFAFKNTTGAFAVGTFTGNGADNRSITGLGFKPNYVWIKNSNATAAEGARFNLTESNNDYSGSFVDANNVVDVIQSLDSDGFTVGTHVAGNENTKTIYWIAFAGAGTPSTSGTYQMNAGTYTGNGSTQSVSSIGFEPDLVIIKHEDQATDQYAVFRTSLMYGDATLYFALSAGIFTGGITSLDSNGFTLGSNATVNTSGDTYHWIAFGNAYNPETMSGARDFAIGAYTGNNSDNRNIIRLPFQPDLVTIKRNDTSSGMFKTSTMVGDSTNFFLANPENTDHIQALNSDGFQVGVAAQVANNTSLFHFFAFKASSTFVVDSYTGTGSSQNITDTSFQPDMLWIKKSTGGTGRGAVLRTSLSATDSALPFLNSPLATTHVTDLLANGFQVGTGNLTNENTFNYNYVAWQIPTHPNTPSLDSPADTATGQSLTPALLTTATDNNSDYIRYKIELCTNVGMTTGCQTFDQTSSQTGWSGQNTETSTAYTSGTQATYTVQSALSGSTTYYWRSYAIDPGGTNVWSSTQTPRSFTTLNPGTPPNTPSLVAPTDTSTNQSTHPTFQTSTTDTESDYLRYKIELCTNVGMTTGCQTFDQTSSQTGWSGQNTQTSTAYTSGSTANYTVVTALSPSTTYYWRSYAIDPGGSLTWSSTQGTPYSFTTRSAYESFSCLIDEAADDSSLTISWSDRESAETNFRLEKNTDNGGFVAYQTLAANTVSYLDTTVAQGHTYQYRVAPYFSSTSTYGAWCTTSTLSLAAGRFQFENINFR